MPNLYAHARFAAEVAAEANLVFEHHEPLYRAGCFGPDIFFYHRLVLPLKNGQQLGRRMHVEHTDDYIRALLSETVKTGNEAEFAYLCGYLCHYCLDSCTHPYIYYMCGHGRSHTAFENAMDAELMALDGASYADIVRACTLRVTPEALAQAGAMVSHAVREAYGVSIPLTWIKQALGGMRRALRVLRDPTGRKRKRMVKFEKLLRVPGFLSFAMLPENRGLDTLNVKHAQWQLPFEPHTVHTESFLDLAEEAKKRALECVRAARDAVNKVSDIGAAMETIGDASLHTGLSWREDLPLKLAGAGEAGGKRTI